jgi:hypothetical protein
MKPSSQTFSYVGYQPTVDFAKRLGWPEDPDWDAKYNDVEGLLDADRAVEDAIRFIESKGYVIR